MKGNTQAYRLGDSWTCELATLYAFRSIVTILMSRFRSVFVEVTVKLCKN